MMPIVLVALGGALGAVCRYLISLALNRGAWPVGTLLINVSGCFLIALFLTAAAERAPWLGGGWRYFFPIGFVGAYTTFSTYEFELWRMWTLREVGAACGYFAASNVLGFAAIVLGSWVARAR
jgi:CrcB protein